MARGFESKAVADQQEAALARSEERRDETPQPVAALRRKRLELARTSVIKQLETARVEAHREMLRRALAALDKDLAQLGM